MLALKPSAGAAVLFCTHTLAAVLIRQVLGAGVAGLAAVQAARGLGAVVHAYDVRPAAREQVESMGGQFLAVNYQEDGSGAGG